MNVLEIRPSLYNPEWREPFWVADIYVDGRRLVEMVRKVEAPFAEREGSGPLPGSYVGLDAANVYLPSQHLLGQPIQFGLSRGRTALLGCVCTWVDCWPLYATVEMGEDRVVWRDFGNPHRGPEYWDDDPEMQRQYEGLGPFMFDRHQYMKALERPIEIGESVSP